MQKYKIYRTFFSYQISSHRERIQIKNSFQGASDLFVLQVLSKGFRLFFKGVPVQQRNTPKSPKPRKPQQALKNKLKKLKRTLYLYVYVQKNQINNI
ncbi:hypothetical protein pb186bvf_011771 [Paramecium bursaria]